MAPPALPLPLRSLPPPPPRCFSFGIGDGASTALIKGIARAVGGSTKFITGQDRMQPKVPQSLKWALQLSVTGISLSWDLPPGIQAELLHWDPEVIFAGQRCLVYAQLHRQPQEGERAPRHSHGGHHPAVSHPGPDLLGDTAVLPAATGWRQVIDWVSIDPICERPASGVRLDEPNQRSVFGRLSRDLAAAQRAPEESPLLRLVSLQNADVSWNLDPWLAAVLGVSETDARGRIPSEDVTPSIWATVLAMVWLHGQAMGQCDESSCWRPRLWAGCGTEQVQTRAGQSFSS
ncbi:unnamed protein product [Eretmochelys imbricata]